MYSLIKKTIEQKTQKFQCLTQKFDDVHCQHIYIKFISNLYQMTILSHVTENIIIT